MPWVHSAFSGSEYPRAWLWGLSPWDINSLPVLKVLWGALGDTDFSQLHPLSFTSELQAAHHLWGSGASLSLQVPPHQPLLFSFGCSLFSFHFHLCPHFFQFLWNEKEVLSLKVEIWNDGDRGGWQGGRAWGSLTLVSGQRKAMPASPFGVEICHFDFF